MKINKNFNKIFTYVEKSKMILLIFAKIKGFIYCLKFGAHNSL